MAGLLRPPRVCTGQQADSLLPAGIGLFRSGCGSDVTVEQGSTTTSSGSGYRVVAEVNHSVISVVANSAGRPLTGALAHILIFGVSAHRCDCALPGRRPAFVLGPHDQHPPLIILWKSLTSASTERKRPPSTCGVQKFLGQRLTGEVSPILNAAAGFAIRDGEEPIQFDHLERVTSIAMQ